MPAATLPIVINILVAGMFVASFLTIAHLNPEFPRIRWFALSYAAGMLTPVAEFLLPLMPVQAPFLVMSYAGLFIGIVLMSPALSMLYERQPAWRVVGAIIVAGIAVRIAIWNGPRGVFWYEMAYQIPFAVASFFASSPSSNMAAIRASTGRPRCCSSSSGCTFCSSPTLP